MNLGLEHWLTSSSDYSLDSVPDGKNATERTELGYAKVAGEWCLAVRRARYEDARSPYSGEFECNVTRVEEAVKLQDSSRDLRIAALEKLPLLISELKQRADEQTRIILDAKKIVGAV